MAMHTHGSYGLGHLITARYGVDLTPDDMIWNLSDGGWAKGKPLTFVWSLTDFAYQ